ncbi:hypothetical protein [Anoxynatronum sibiricum]|uniref:Uncharacterized protein n=1 Tax=Anoxynatronum sibiricum TaxID=210623 RepID=A0ABU9VUC2_9CLOT
MTGQTGISLYQPEAQLLPSLLAFYSGSPYDGGYSDLVVDNHLLVVCYDGNEAGEPGIDGALISLKT